MWVFVLCGKLRLLLNINRLVEPQISVLLCSDKSDHTIALDYWDSLKRQKSSILFLCFLALFLWNHESVMGCYFQGRWLCFATQILTSYWVCPTEGRHGQKRHFCVKTQSFYILTGLRLYIFINIQMYM